MLHWVFIVVHRLSLPALCGGFSLVVVHGLFIVVASSCCRTWAPECIGFSSYSMRAQPPQDMWNLSSWTRDQTHVPCIGRHICNHWTTRQVQHVVCSLKAYIGWLISNIRTHSYYYGPYSEGFSWKRTNDLLPFFPHLLTCSLVFFHNLLPSLSDYKYKKLEILIEKLKS